MPGKHRARQSARTSPPTSGRARTRPTGGKPVGVFVVPAIIALLIAGGATYFGLEKRVTLVVDGEARSVRAFGGTVSDLLEGQGLDLGSHDKLSPGPQASLSEGMEIRLLVAKEITLVLNGQRRAIWVTGGSTVAEVLDLINIRAGRNAYLEPSRGATLEDGDTIVYRAAVAVRVTVDGKTRDVITNATRVGRLLDSLGVTVGRRDRVIPGIKNAVEPGSHIRVVRVNVRRAVANEAIAFDVEVRYSDDMAQGQEEVTREGVQGVRRSVYRVRTEDGREVSRTLLQTTVLQEPVARIVVRGTAPAPAGGGTNVQYGEATWYYRDGMVAAHKTLPFGTQVTVTNLANGKTVTVVINDRGPYGEGRIIDLSDDAFAQLAHLGAGVIDVRITW